MLRSVAMLALIAMLAPGSAEAADTAAGQAVFARCKICHTTESGGRSLVGPNLHGLFGRKAGSQEGFAYSEGMKNSGIVWDDDKIRQYLAKPRDFIPGNKMAFPGIKDENEISNLLAYLHEATK